jgi:two-component system, OmpR family, phosphate regulon sensor histidine kinase PhoR
MRRGSWLFHPISIFVFSTVALVLSLFLYIYWYVEVSTGLEAMVRKLNLEPVQVLAPQTWVVVLVLSILVGIILMGIFTIFVYNQKTLQLYRLQHNFINNFTHELRTPVTSLKLFLETFLKYDLARADQEKYIHYMLSDVGRLTDNINRILNLARLESKSYQADFRMTDLVQAIEELRETHAPLFEGCDIRIHPPGGEPWRYPVDRPLFDILVMNLLTNAVKYNASSRPRIDIRFDAGRRNLRLRFEDNGIGIGKGEARKIFRRFYQTGRPGRMMAKGSGLGLSLVQNIARLHKGRVEAESRMDGEGSVFTLILPKRKKTFLVEEIQ